jgi:hypothetical protein
LLKGEDTPANAWLAAQKLRQILKNSRGDTAPSAVRVADVIERCLTLHKDKYSEEAFEKHFRFLQLFAEAYGWRKANDLDCLPVHV